MISSKIFESLECGLSTHLKHISINPIAISCGHTVCKQCIPKNVEENITCCHCNTSQKVPIDQNESLPTKSLFTVLIDKMFEYIEDKFKNSLENLKNTFFEDNLNIQIDLLKNDIDIRIESLKYELDLIAEKLFKRLDEIGVEIIKDKFDNEPSSDNIVKNFEENLNELVKYNSEIKEKTEEDFSKFQTYLKKLYETNERLFDNNYELKFEPSDEAIKECTIGKIIYFNKFKIDSTIITGSEFVDLKRLCEFNQRSNFTLLYRGTRDGFRAIDFHSKCDSKSPTLTIIKTDIGCVFGGYTEAKWTSIRSTIYDSNAFIFSCKKHIKAKVQNAHNAIFSDPNYGPIFGGYWNGYSHLQNDIIVSDCSNTSYQSITNFPSTYSSNAFQLYCLNDGTPNFNVAEIEVFMVEN